MNWHQLTSTTALEAIKEESKQDNILIFKHSTRCSISATALNRLQRAWQEQAPIKPYYLDLLNYREISNAIAQDFDIRHESPQVLLIKDGKCIYHASHLAISYQELVQEVTQKVR